MAHDVSTVSASWWASNKPFKVTQGEEKRSPSNSLYW